MNACIANVRIESLFYLSSFTIINDGPFSVDGALTIGHSLFPLLL